MEVQPPAVNTKMEADFLCVLEQNMQRSLDPEGHQQGAVVAMGSPPADVLHVRKINPTSLETEGNDSGNR